MRLNIADKIKEIDWFNYLIELLVVILGVSIAFMLDNWKENQKNLELEKNFLTSFHSEILKDKTNLDTLVVYEDSSLTNVSGLMQKYFENSTVTKDEKFYIVGKMLTLNFFNTTTNTIEFVKSNGNFGIIKNYFLMEKIVEYYQNIEEKKYLEGFQTNYVNEISIPYINKNLDMFSQEFINDTKESSTEFKNVTLGYYVLAKQCYEFDKKLQRLNKALLENLEKELKERF